MLSTTRSERLVIAADTSPSPLWDNGIGAQMLTVLLTEAEAAGYVRYRLSTHLGLHAARSIYRRAGFCEVPGSPDFAGIVAAFDICIR